MPYVARDQDGNIIAVHAAQSPAAREKLPVDHPDLRQILGDTKDSAEIQNALVASDLELVRVLEDLITVLIDKRVIMLTDLPAAAQHKLSRRYELRSRMADLGGIVSDQEEFMLP